MKKALTLFAFAALLSANAFARYVVVMKDGTLYKAKEKWTVVNGKALIKLENGQTLQVDPSFIDVAKSEQLTKMGITDANIVDLNTQMPDGGQPRPPKAQQPSLGSSIRLRQPKAQEQQNTPSPVNTVAGSVSPAVLEKFERAFENIGIFERKIVSTGKHSLRAELTVDTEDRVFNAVSATSFLIMKNAGVNGAHLDVVELFMKTTIGLAAGRFQMTRAHAEALEARKVSQHDYFIRNVIY